LLQILKTKMNHSAITQKDIHDVLRQTLPEQNDFSDSNYSEELEELLLFGIQTKVQLLDLVVKHREAVLEIDREPLNEQLIKWYKEDLGIHYVEERIKKEFWFSYSGLLRIILELEFGQNYIDYADKRDNLEGFSTKRLMVKFSYRPAFRRINHNLKRTTSETPACNSTINTTLPIFPVYNCILIAMKLTHSNTFAVCCINFICA